MSSLPTHSFAKPLVIATRGSKLALWQAEHIRSRLLAEYPSLPGVELLVLKTRGDIIIDVPLSKVGGKGLFIKEIEEALLDGRADIAVHSMKDLPMDLPEGLTLAVIPEREAPEDMFLSMRYSSPEELPHGARLGTSSLRRQAQILARRPDLEILSLRGNIDTRLRRLEEGLYDAIILAGAGLRRLGLTAPRACPLPPDEFLPAAGQGALGVEIRTDRDDLHALLNCMHHRSSAVTVQAERGFLAGCNGGCHVPIAARATMPDDASVEITGLVASSDGTRVIRETMRGPAGDARALGLALAEIIKKAGGAEILAAIDCQRP